MSQLEGRFVRAFQLPITKGWVIGQDETHLKTGKDHQVLVFSSERSAQRAADAHNRSQRFDIDGQGTKP